VNEIVFHVDYSKINLVWMILDALSTKLEQRSSELSLDLTNQLLSKLEAARVEIYNIKPEAINLKTEQQQMLSQSNSIISAEIKDLKTTSSELRQYILLKVNSSRTEIISLQNNINSLSNVSNSTKNSLKTKVASIDTYLYNIYSKIENPNNLTESDWAKITREIDAVESALNSFQATLTASANKADKIQASLDKIYNDITSLQIKNAATIVNPITTTIKPVVPEQTHLGYMFPALVLLVVMFISILLSTTLVMMERHSPAYFRNFITPTPKIFFVIGTYLTNLILVFVQLAIILGISSYFLKTQILSNVFPTLTAILLLTTLFTFIGMAIGYLFNSEETAVLAALSVGSIFLFLSSVILPIESMPAYVNQIAQFNPFVIGESILRQALIFQAGFGALANSLYIILAYGTVFFILILVLQSTTSRRLFKKIVQIKHKK
ncbi:MAG: ABC transporter permease, partial [Candidatus Nanoarchaeia archaeon]